MGDTLTGLIVVLVLCGAGWLLGHVEPPAPKQDPIENLHRLLDAQGLRIDRLERAAQ